MAYQIGQKEQERYTANLPPKKQCEALSKGLILTLGYLVSTSLFWKLTAFVGLNIILR